MASDPHRLDEVNSTSNAGPESNSLESWLAIYGDAEYAMYKREAATPYLSYEEWAASQHVLGPFLYHVTLNAWDEESSADEESGRQSQPAVSGLPDRKKSENAAATDTRSFHSTNTPKSGAGTKAGETSSSKKRLGKKNRTRSSISHGDNIEYDSVAEAATPTTRAAPPDAPETTSATRRGLRVRTPAQQRPYYHHAKLYVEHDSEDGEAANAKKSTLRGQATKLAEVFYNNSLDAGFANEHQLVTNDHPGENSASKSKKGSSPPKGRQWKKNKEEVNRDYTEQVERKLCPERVPKKRGRPRKHPLPNSPTSKDGVKNADAEGFGSPPSSRKKPKPKGGSKNLGETFLPKVPAIRVEKAAEQDPSDSKKPTSRGPRRKARKSAAIITASDDETGDDELPVLQQPAAQTEDKRIEQGTESQAIDKNENSDEGNEVASHIEPMPREGPDRESTISSSSGIWGNWRNGELEDSDFSSSMAGEESPKTPLKKGTKSPGSKKKSVRGGGNNNGDYRPNYYAKKKATPKGKQNPKKEEQNPDIEMPDVQDGEQGRDHVEKDMEDNDGENPPKIEPNNESGGNAKEMSPCRSSRHLRLLF